jgi:hypothetical protein
MTPQCYCLVLWSITKGCVVALEPVNGVGHRLMGAYLRFACHFYPGCVANAYHRFLTPSASFLHAAPTPASLQVRFQEAGIDMSCMLAPSQQYIHARDLRNGNWRVEPASWQCLAGV